MFAGRVWFALAASVGYLAVAATRHDGLAHQPCLVLARSKADFAAEIQAAGGPASVHTGILLDFGFVLMFMVAAALLLRHEVPRWWWVPVVAAVCDSAENGLLWVLVSRDPGAGGLAVLLTLAVAKFALYALTIGLLVRAGYVQWRRAPKRAAPGDR